MSKLDTINIVQYDEDTVTSIASFTDDSEGVNAAEGIFSALVKESDAQATDEEIADMLSDGWYESGTYQVFIVHSG